MWQLIRDLVAEGVAILLTTQYLEEADQLADRIAVLDQGRIVAQGTPEELKRRISGAEVPLRRDATLVNLQVQAGPGGQPHVETETAPKFVSRDSTTAVTYRQAAIIVETTKYRCYERVRELVALAVRARQVASPIDGVDRIGLRYINEIRAPGVDADGSPMRGARG